VVHQLVVGRAQDGVAGVGAETCLVDQALRVFDAVADRKGLGFHVHAAFMQHREGVAGAVAQRQHDMVRPDLLAVLQGDTADVAILDLDVGDVLLEADFAAQRHDVGTDLFDHADQAEGANVRFAHVQDLFGRAGLDEFGEHLAGQVARVADLAVELAVGKGARPTLAKLHVGLRVKHALAPQAPGVLGALTHFLAALQHDGTQAHLSQDQGGEDAAGAEAHHHRTQVIGCTEIGGRVAHKLVRRVRRRANVRVTGHALEHMGFQLGRGQLAIDRVDQHDGRLLARVVAALEHGEIQELGILDAQSGHHGRTQLVLGVVQGQTQFSDSQHGSAMRGQKNPIEH